MRTRPARPRLPALGSPGSGRRIPATSPVGTGHRARGAATGTHRGAGLALGSRPGWGTAGPATVLLSGTGRGRRGAGTGTGGERVHARAHWALGAPSGWPARGNPGLLHPGAREARRPRRRPARAARAKGPLPRNDLRPSPRPAGALARGAGCGEHLRRGQSVLRGHEQQGQAVRLGKYRGGRPGPGRGARAGILNPLQVEGTARWATWQRLSAPPQPATLCARAAPATRVRLDPGCAAPRQTMKFVPSRSGASPSAKGRHQEPFSEPLRRVSAARPPPFRWTPLDCQVPGRWPEHQPLCAAPRPSSHPGGVLAPDLSAPSGAGTKRSPRPLASRVTWPETVPPSPPAFLH